MFDQYVLVPGSVCNVEENGRIVGYQMETRISYYRGVPISMIHQIQVETDQLGVSRELIRFSADGMDFFTLDEMETVAALKWEYGTKGIVRVIQEGGLSVGEHTVRLTQAIRVAYIPVPFEGTREEIVTIGA